MAKNRQVQAGQETTKAFGAFLGTLPLGEAETHENMTVFPVFSAKSPAKKWIILLLD